MLSLTQSPEIDRYIFLGACIFIIIAGIKMVSDFIGPLVIAIFAAIIFSVISNWLRKKGFSSGLAKGISFGLFIVGIFGMLFLVGIALTPILTNLLHYQENINENLSNLQIILNNSGIKAFEMIEVTKLGSSMMSFSLEGITFIANQMSDLGIVIFSTFFLLLEANGFSRKIQKIIGTRNETMLKNVQEFAHIIIEYIIIRTKVNLTIGIIFTIVLYALGVEGALLWGFLMFVFGYIPYVGFLIAIIPPTIIAWIDIGPVTALIALIAAIIINTLAENILFPQLAGSGLHLSPTIIFISLLFWGFLLGGSGFILGVPLTVLVYALLKSSESTKWVADLMSIEEEMDLLTE